MLLPLQNHLLPNFCLLLELLQMTSNPNYSLALHNILKL